MLEIDERAIWPETPAQLLTRNELAWPLQQQREDLERLRRKVEARPCLAQFSCVEIQFEYAEPDDATSRPWKFTHPGT